MANVAVVLTFFSTLRFKEVKTRNKELEVQAVHLRIRALDLERGSPNTSKPVSIHQNSGTASAGFDLSKHINLVPPFRESKVDFYLSAF